MRHDYPKRKGGGVGLVREMLPLPVARFKSTSLPGLVFYSTPNHMGHHEVPK